MLRLFLSHSWDYNDHRDGLQGLISTHWTYGVDWCDLSVPRTHPLHVTGGTALRAELRQRILRCDALIAFAGIYSSHSDWIDFEVTTAAAQYKPVIGVRPRGQKNISSVIADDAWKIVGWNGHSAREAVMQSLPQIRYDQVAQQLRLSEFISDLFALAPRAALPGPPTVPFMLPPRHPQ